MADVKKFKFVSPGIFLNEIDNSQIPRLPDDIGPVIIGRAERGPNMRPVRIDSFAEFVETFGEPIAGKGGSGDAWRDGNYSSPTYGGYAAQAYLKNSSPITFVKLAGVEHPDYTTAATRAGWKTTSHSNLYGATTAGSAPGAYGLFVGGSGSGDGGNIDMVHAATFYVERGSLGLRGTAYSGDTISDHSGGMNVVVKNSTAFGSACFTMRVYDQYQSDGSTAATTGSMGTSTGLSTGPSNAVSKDVTFNFNLH